MEEREVEALRRLHRREKRRRVVADEVGGEKEERQSLQTENARSRQPECGDAAAQIARRSVGAHPIISPKAWARRQGLAGSSAWLCSGSLELHFCTPLGKRHSLIQAQLHPVIRTLNDKRTAASHHRDCFRSTHRETTLLLGLSDQPSDLPSAAGNSQPRSASEQHNARPLPSLKGPHLAESSHNDNTRGTDRQQSRQASTDQVLHAASGVSPAGADQRDLPARVETSRWRLQLSRCDRTDGSAPSSGRRGALLLRAWRQQRQAGGQACLQHRLSESELGILDLIQVFVESLDRCFENVCELDLIFHFDHVHAILNEVIQGGLVVETNINEIVAAAHATARARKASAATAGSGPAAAVGNSLGNLAPTALNISLPGTSGSSIPWPKGTFMVDAISNLGNQYLGRSSGRR
ncbi:hypothetical protein L1887_57143 [Cichorium endivia]|nr:hypothetical protein L1887_57143 [Cichorium endivia]